MANQLEGLAALPSTLTQNLKALSPIQRMGLLALLGLALAAIPVLVLKGFEPDMTVLFSNLEQGDVQAIVAQLEAQNVPYELIGDGQTIKVPQDRVHMVRLQLAGLGLPESSGVGFELFDRVGLGVTKFVQQVNYRRALQGELARTISQMPEVQVARIHLVIPEKRLFTADKEPARAAVALTLRRGAKLSPSQVQGLQHLVASSVEGLDAAKVTLMDGHGEVLSRHETDSESQLTKTQLDMQREVEKDFEHRVQTMLDQVLGSTKSVVRVSALLDFRQVETTKEVFDPESQVVRSEQRSQEKIIGEEGTTEPQGVPGTSSNLPSDQPVQGSIIGNKEAKRKNETLNYEINRTVNKIVEPTGTIQHLSVAVLVDGTIKAVTNAETGKTTQQYVPRSNEEMQSLNEVIKKAVGFSSERGDEIEVTNIPFHTTGEEEEVTPDTTMRTLLADWGVYLKPLVFLLLGLLVLLFVVRPLVQSVTVRSETAALPQPGGLPVTVGELEATLAPPQDKIQALQLAMNNPQATTYVVKQWIKDKS